MYRDFSKFTAADVGPIARLKKKKEKRDKREFYALFINHFFFFKLLIL